MKIFSSVNNIYKLLFVLAILLYLAALFFAHTNIYTTGDTSEGFVITPSSCELLDYVTREYHFTDIDWTSDASCLRFATSHQEVSVTADNSLLFERKVAQKFYGNTTGWGWEFIEIPDGTKEVVVTLTATYDVATDSTMTFYQGSCYSMFYSLLKKSLFSIIMCALNMIVGFALVICWILLHRKGRIGHEVLYLGIFGFLLGLWSALETNFSQLIFPNREVLSFASPAILMMMSIPFMLFFHAYLEDENKHLCPAMIILSLTQTTIVYILHFTRIAYLRETLLSTQTMMALACGYFFITLAQAYKKKKIMRRVRVASVGLIALAGAFVVDIIAVNTHMSDSDVFGRTGCFIFMIVLGGNASAEALNEVNKGREALIYKQIAEQDTLTGCFNRNAYFNDTLPEKIKDKLLLVTFDLNNLKFYNDTFGHACGDQYLVDSASIMQKCFGEYGKVYRIGGDEFCLLVQPETECDIDRVMVDFMREQIEYNTSSKNINLQIACGYSRYESQFDMDLEETRERADILMYKNKRELKAAAVSG